MAEPIPLVRSRAIPLVRVARYGPRAAADEPSVIVDPALYEEARRRRLTPAPSATEVARRLFALVDR